MTALVAALLAVASPPAPTSAANLVTVAEIDKRCGSAEKALRSKSARIFAELSDEVTPAPPRTSWREFRKLADLENATGDGPPETQAKVWTFPDGITFVAMFFTSGSGDWAHFADQCFRADGTLARVADTLNTFNAISDDESADSPGVSRVRIKYFAADGTFLKKKSRVVDLTTKKPVRWSYMDQEDVVYPRLADLPFYTLLKTVPVKAPP